MQPRMTEHERQLFASLLACSDRYLEFGCGGSTALAAERVRKAIISVESDRAWTEEVAKYCAARPASLQPEMVYVDIGPTGAWGTPRDPAARDRWPDYHSRIWENPRAADSDLVMIDGRFRVACALQTLLHTRSETMIMIHDYTDRTQYHIVETLMRPVARAETLWVFQRRRDHDQNGVRALLKDHALTTD
jgi:hypothetical protein